MSIATIVTRGYGSFGSIGDVTRAGYEAAAGAGEVFTPPTTTVVVGDGHISWEDHVKAVHEMRMLENQIRVQKKELKKVVQKIKSVEKKQKTEGILANLLQLEFKKEEIETKIQALEVDLEPLILAIEKMEIEEDDQEFMSLQ